MEWLEDFWIVTTGADEKKGHHYVWTQLTGAKISFGENVEFKQYPLRAM